MAYRLSLSKHAGLATSGLIGLVFVVGAANIAIAKAPNKKTPPVASNFMKDPLPAPNAAAPDAGAPGVPAPGMSGVGVPAVGDAPAAPEAMNADAMPAKGKKAKAAARRALAAKPAGADAAMPGKAVMELPPVDDDFISQSGDPPAKPLRIVDAFRVDGPVTPERIAALKRAAAKRAEVKAQAAPKR